MNYKEAFEALVDDINSLGDNQEYGHFEYQERLNDSARRLSAMAKRDDIIAAGESLGATRGRLWDDSMAKQATHIAVQAALSEKAAQHDLQKARAEAAVRKLEIMQEHCREENEWDMHQACREVISGLRGDAQ